MTSAALELPSEEFMSDVEGQLAKLADGVERLSAHVEGRMAAQRDEQERASHPSDLGQVACLQCSIARAYAMP